MSRPKLYADKIAGGIKAYIGFVQYKGYGRYIPNTVLEGDIRLKTIHADRIIVTYRKYRNEAKYTEIVYAAKGVKWDTLELPEEYQYLIIFIDLTSLLYEELKEYYVINKYIEEQYH